MIEQGLKLEEELYDPEAQQGNTDPELSIRSRIIRSISNFRPAMPVRLAWSECAALVLPVGVSVRSRRCCLNRSGRELFRECARFQSNIHRNHRLELVCQYASRHFPAENMESLESTGALASRHMPLSLRDPQ